MPQNKVTGSRSRGHESSSDDESWHSGSSSSSYYSVRTTGSGRSSDRSSVDISDSLVVGPEAPHDLRFYLHTNQQFYSASSSDTELNAVERWSASRKQWVSDRDAFVKGILLKAIPYILQGAGRAVAGKVGNAMYVAGQAAQGIEPAINAASQAYKAYRGDRDFNALGFAGNVAQLAGAGVRAAGAYGGFPAHTGYSLQAGGNLAVAAGGVTASFPGPPPRHPQTPASGSRAAGHTAPAAASSTQQRPVPASVSWAAGHAPPAAVHRSQQGLRPEGDRARVRRSQNWGSLVPGSQPPTYATSTSVSKRGGH